MLPENCCLSVLFLAYAEQYFYSFYCLPAVQELMWTQMGALQPGWLLVPLRQVWFMVLAGRGREKGLQGIFLFFKTKSVPWRKEHEADTRPALSSSPASSLVTFASGNLLQQELLCAGTDGCGVTGRRRRWGTCCCLIYMPSTGVVLGQVHQGVCVRAEMQSRLVRSA